MGDVYELRRASRVLLDETLTVHPEPSAARRARHWVMKGVTAQGIGGRAHQVVELLTAELVTNALQHGPLDGEVGVRVCVEVRGVSWVVRVVVHDEGSALPQVREAAASDLHGRGMALVAALSSAWGTSPSPGGGKTVWFEVDTDD